MWGADHGGHDDLAAGRYAPKYDEVRGAGFDFNVPQGYGYNHERTPLKHADLRHGPHPYQAKVDDGLFKDANHHLETGDFAEQDEYEKQAGMSKHHCTDMMCTTLFLGAVFLLCLLVNYGIAEGDIQRLSRGYNFTGQLCGVDAPGKPYVYWCQKRHGTPGGNVAAGLDLRHPICVEACPTAYNTTRTCFRKMEKEVKPATQLPDGSYYIEETSKYVFANVHDYISEPFLDRYCLPKDAALGAQLRKALNSHGMTQRFTQLSEVASAKVPLACAVLIAFVLGYLYIFLLDKCATCLVYTAIFISIALTCLIGLYLVISQFFGGIDGVPGTGDSGWNWLCGLGLIGLSVMIGLFAIHSRNQIEVAIACVQAAADCMFDMPTLMLEPLVTLILKIVLFLALARGFLQLASVGKVKEMTIEQFSHYYEADADNKISGVFRTFQYHESQRMYMFFYIAVSMWILCVVTALSQFVIAYSVQLWYFTPYVDEHKDAPSCTLWRGYWIGLGYHLGSLAYGALVVTCFWIVEVTLGVIAKAAEMEGNACVSLIAKCLFCCIACYERFIEFLNKNAYMDIAINSTSFCTAARNAVEVIHSQMAAVSILNGATFVFTVAGHAMITTVGTFLVWTMVNSLWMFNNVESRHYVTYPIPVCCVAAVICYAVSVGFMLVFDMVADSILYCYASEKRRKDRGLLPHELQYAPDSLKRLVAKHSSSEFHDYPDDSYGAKDPYSDAKDMHLDFNKVDAKASAAASAAYAPYLADDPARHG